MSEPVKITILIEEKDVLHTYPTFYGLRLRYSAEQDIHMVENIEATKVRSCRLLVALRDNKNVHIIISQIYMQLAYIYVQLLRWWETNRMLHVMG